MSLYTNSPVSQVNFCFLSLKMFVSEYKYKFKLTISVLFCRCKVIIIPLAHKILLVRLILAYPNIYRM